MVKVSVAITTYNLPDTLEDLVNSLVSRKHEIEILIYRHSNISSTEDKCNDLAKRDNVKHFFNGVNPNVSFSWNEGIKKGFKNGSEFVIVSNDDILYSKGDLDRFIDFVLENQHETSWFSSYGYWHNTKEFSSNFAGNFAVTKKLWKEVGAFDENFMVAYYEDTDYHYRMSLVGVKWLECKNVNVEHLGGSTGKRTYRLYERVLRPNLFKNKAYYIQKWGSDRGKEVFKKPFNQDIFNHYIDPEKCHNPYGRFDRTDGEKVVRNI